jgi:hypothetical protein
MKVAQYGTTIVVIHAIVNGLHGLAHQKIPIPLSLFQGLFVGIVIFPTPIIAAVLLWTQFDRIGSWLLLSSMAAAGLFGVYNHYIVISPDHVSQISLEGWGLVFQITAFLIPLVDGLGCAVGVWALKAVPQNEKVL